MPNALCTGPSRAVRPCWPSAPACRFSAAPSSVPTASTARGSALLDCTSTRGTGPRAVGELVVEPTAEASLPTLSGYENHGGVTTLGPDARPAGRVRTGVGNGDGERSEGVVVGRIWGTYLHGPVLARNPALADLLLSWVVGPLRPLDDAESNALRTDRLRMASAEASAGAHRRAGWRQAVERAKRSRQTTP